ncbi:MAG TPA: glycosyltransferase [Marinilabiliaceae bacterium]|nr:glycosyltransferase [Marinilabiliaceae bacterium]
MKKRKVIITVSNNLVTDHRVSKMADYLTSRKLEVVITGRNWPKSPMIDTKDNTLIRFNLFFNKGFLFYLNLNLRIFWYLLTHKSDYYLAVDLDTLLACRLAGFIRRVPVIFDSHEYFPEVPELRNRPFVKSVWKTIQDWTVPGVKGAITVSKGVADLYKSLYNKEFVIVRNIPSKGGAVYPIRLSSQTPIIYYQGALNVGRGLEEAIEAMTFLPNNYQLQIAGAGDIEDKLKQLVVELGLSERVKFLGMIPFSQLHNFASKAHVGLCLLHNMGFNYYYSLPNRLFDYPKMGLPVIATNFPDISNFVETYETGILMDDMKPIKLAGIIRSICEDLAYREKVGAKMLQAVEQLNWENEVLVLDTLFV